MGIRIRTAAVALAVALAACGARQPKPVTTPPNSLALLIVLDPRVIVPPVTDPSIDIGRMFGESMLAAMAQDPRIQFPDRPPANVLHLVVRQYGQTAQGQYTMTASAELDDPSGRKLWGGTQSLTMGTLQMVSDELARRTRGQMMTRHSLLVGQAGVATELIGARPPRLAPPVAAPAPVAPAPVADTALDERSGTVSRPGAGLRKKPRVDLPVGQALPSGTALRLSSRLENDTGIWWYAKSGDTAGWIPEADVSLK